ncbi:MAG: hypothetical protein Q7U47_12320 [Paludibacter sp.]|nr:hypothetical protein [Paludibacter sp.]
MKTSNKLLIGAFVLILAGMIISNFYIKSEIGKIKNDNKTEQIIQDTDSAKQDSTYQVHININ